MVKWISRRSSEPLLGVRIPLGAQSAGHFVQGGTRRREPGSCKFSAENYA